jgi:hypothetical protein
MVIASTIASAAMGMDIVSSRIIRELAKERGGAEQATLWFDGGRRLPIGDAARVNAVMSDAAASDDSDLRSIAHIGTIVSTSSIAGGEDRHPTCLELGGPDAPGVRHRRAGVCPLWRPPTADRHAARSRGYPEDPRAPRPRSLGAESRPRPTRIRTSPRPDRIGSGSRGTPSCLRREVASTLIRPAAGRLTAAVCLA